ncbi:MAG TPA: MotA/TolQ/ExbB proton channel family protein [bacterium]|nr:MotA/TolQ/ExbB proton channel family protein [bacterium]
MDIGTVVGLVLVLGLLVGAIGSGIMSFIDLPSIMITCGGTFSVVLIQFPVAQVLNLGGVAKNAFFTKPQSPLDVVSLLVSFSEKARREGILSLESSMDEVQDNLIRTGLRLAVDGVEPELIKDILHTELAFIEDRHKSGTQLMEYMATAAPAFGMIGTLVGLVLMLQTLDDPSTIGPSMAVAILTTLYGAVIANALCTPIAGKLKIRTSEEILLKEIAIEGVMSIQSGDNPRILEQKLLAFLPPSIRPAREE